MQTHWVTFAFVSAFRLFLHAGCEFRRFFLGWQKAARVRQAGAGPPSHNSCSVIVASEDSVDFWEGTVEKYTSFSKLPAQPPAGLKIEAAIGRLLVTVKIWGWLFTACIQYILSSAPSFSPDSFLCVINVLSFEVMTHAVPIPRCTARFVCGPAHTKPD